MMKRLRLGPDADEGLNVGHVASTDWADAVAAVSKTASKQGARSGGGEPYSTRTPGYSPDASLCGELIVGYTHSGEVASQAGQGIDKEENTTNALKNDDIQGVGKEATPKPSSGCCSML